MAKSDFLAIFTGYSAGNATTQKSPLFSSLSLLYFHFDDTEIRASNATLAALQMALCARLLCYSSYCSVRSALQCKYLPIHEYNTLKSETRNIGVKP